MSPVDFKKWRRHPVEFKGQGSLCAVVGDWQVARCARGPESDLHNTTGLPPGRPLGRPLINKSGELDYQ